MRLRPTHLPVFYLLTALPSLLALLPAFAHSAGHTGLAAFLFQAQGEFCHQATTRSIFLGTVQAGVCSRCFGIYLGLPVGLLLGHLRPALARVPRSAVLASLVPMAIDWLGTATGQWSPCQVVRLGTGLMAALAVCSHLSAMLRIEIGEVK